MCVAYCRTLRQLVIVGCNLALVVGRPEMSGARLSASLMGHREETALLSLADNGRPAAATAEPEQEGPKLSKSQLMRLRKKKREGKM